MTNVGVIFLLTFNAT